MYVYDRDITYEKKKLYQNAYRHATESLYSETFISPRFISLNAKRRTLVPEWLFFFFFFRRGTLPQKFISLANRRYGFVT